MKQSVQYFKEAAEILSCVIAALTLMSLVLSAMFPLDPLTFFFLLYAILLLWIGLRFWNNYAAMCRRAEREAYLRSEIQRFFYDFLQQARWNVPLQVPTDIAEVPVAIQRTGDLHRMVFIVRLAEQHRQALSPEDAISLRNCVQADVEQAFAGAWRQVKVGLPFYRKSFTFLKVEVTL